MDDANVLDTIAEGSVDYAFGDEVFHHLELPRLLLSSRRATRLSRVLTLAVETRWLQGQAWLLRIDLRRA